MSRGASLRYHADQRIQRERAAEQKQLGLRKLLQDQSSSAAYSQFDQRAENLRRQRDEATERRELFIDGQYLMEEQERQRKKHLGEIEERLAHELQMRRAKAAQEEAERRRICEGSEELRNLKGRLQAAAVNQTRAMQLLERQARDQEQDEREHAVASHLEDKRLRELELEHALEIEKQKQRMLVKQSNQEQIDARERQKLEEGKRDYMRDKAEVDALVARITAEDRGEAAARRAKMETEQKVIMEHRREKQSQEEAFRQWEAAQDARNEEFVRNKREREESIAKAKEQQELERRRIIYAMLDEQVGRKREAENHQRILDDLHHEERLEEDRQKAVAEARKKAENQALLRQHAEQSQREKEERLRRQSEDEKRYREELMAKYAEDDRIEQMSNQKRRMKVQEHMREVDRQVLVRRQEYEAARQRELRDQENALASENERRRIIEEERQRLLSEAAPLRNFFTKGTYAHESDLALVGDSLPPRPPCDRPRSLGQSSSQRRIGGSAAQAWGTPPSTPGPDIVGQGAVAAPEVPRYRRRTLGGIGLSI